MYINHDNLFSKTRLVIYNLSATCRDSTIIDMGAVHLESRHFRKGILFSFAQTVGAHSSLNTLFYLEVIRIAL